MTTQGKEESAQQRAVAESVVLRFLDYLRAEKGASPHTLEAYARQYRMFVEWMGPRFLSWEACSAEEYRAWLYEAMQQELKPASIRQRFAALRSLYTYLMLREGYSSNPLADVTLPRARTGLPVHLSLKQMEELLSLPLRTPADKKSPAWLPYRDTAILELFYSCGIRLSELVSLNADALSGGADCVRVMGKGRKVRLVPVGEYARDARGHPRELRQLRRRLVQFGRISDRHCERQDRGHLHRKHRLCHSLQYRHLRGKQHHRKL